MTQKFRPLKTSSLEGYIENCNEYLNHIRLVEQFKSLSIN